MLCWHVDYWDYLGWKDPFGDKAYSARQQRYKEAHRLKVKGTPQFFIDNKVVPWVKGAWKKIPGQIDTGAAKAAKIRIDATATLSDSKIEVTVQLAKLDSKLELAKGVVVVPVLYRKAATTKCDKGENKGRTLREFFIPIAMHKPLSVKKALDKGVKAKLTLPKGLGAADVGVAILVEDADKLRIIECIAVPVRGPSVEK